MFALFCFFQCKSIEKHGQFRARQDALGIVPSTKHFERALLQSLIEKPKSIAVPDQDFDPVASFVEEEVQGSAHRILFQLVLDDGEQAVVLFAEIDGLRVSENSDQRGNA